MNSVQQTFRGSGRGAILQQMQDMAVAPPLMGNGHKPSRSVQHDFPATIRGTGRGRLLEMMAEYKAASVSTSMDSAKSNNPVGLTGRSSRIKLMEMMRNASLTNSSSCSDSIVSESNESEVVVEKTLSNVVSKRGTAGTPVNVSTNYIRLKTEPGKGVFEYLVTFEPDTPSKKLRNHLLLVQHKSFIGPTKTFDGSTLFLPMRLPNNCTTLTSVQEVSETQRITYTLKVIFRRQQSATNCMQLYNVIFGRIMKELNYVRFGRKNFDPTAPTVIPHHKLEVWPGYVTAVDEYEGGIMLCLDVSHRVLCQNTVLELLTNAYHSDQVNFRQLAINALVGTVVLTRYTNNTYRIDDIDFDQNPKHSFTGRNDIPITYIEYFKTHYNIDIQDTRQPLLVHNRSVTVIGQDAKKFETIYLIPELCYLTGITDHMRSDFQVMRDIASITRVTPNQRDLALRTYCMKVSKTPSASAILSGWGLTIDPEPMRLQARQLDPETISFRRQQISAGVKGNFEATNSQLLETIDLHAWLVIHTKCDAKFVRNFIECMERNSRPMGITVSRPEVHVIESDRCDQYVKTLQSVVKAHHQMVVVFCPTARDDRYAAIKKVCCGQLEIASQVIVGRTLSNVGKNRAIVQKIALQMNCKMGGTLWSVNIPFRNVMICGMDTYHDADQKHDSVAAFVSSINGTYTKWFSQSVIQRRKEELNNGLCVALVRSLHAYHDENGMFPDKIIIYRDGVGDGQLKMCSLYEIPQLQGAFELVEPAYRPTLTFVVVQKRIHTRIFAINSGELSNPSPGCVLDHTITRCGLYDFFLVPQRVTQGTVTPTHYTVVHDSANFPPDILQRLTFKLCFLYYNWPGPIRVPACCQYAHKLAYLVGQHVRRPTAESLAKKLFYL